MALLSKTSGTALHRVIAERRVLAAFAAASTCFACTEPTAPATLAHLAPPATTQLVAGGGHTCLLTPQGALLCWGTADVAGGDPYSATPPVWVSAPALVSISLGSDFTCGLNTQGRAYCWGRNDFGQLGDGTRTQRTTPAPVQTSLRFVELSGGTAACGLTPDGRVFCWGPGDRGELGDGVDTAGHYSALPAPVRTDVKFTHMAAGLMGACGIAMDGQTWCWGEAGTIPAATATAATVAQSEASCGGTYDINARCAVPVIVGGGHRFDSLALSSISACGLDGQDVAWCWGLAQWGTLGDGISTFHAAVTPVRVATDRPLTKLSAGADFVCALDSVGSAWCWGNNFHGRLGNGSTAGGSTSPVAVVGGLSFTDLRSGGIHTCGITTDQSIYCWGVNPDGQLGQPPSALPLSPVPVRVDLPPAH